MSNTLAGYLLGNLYSKVNICMSVQLNVLDTGCGNNMVILNAHREGYNL